MADAEIDDMIKKLSLGKQKLGPAHILELQRTLFEACRITGWDHTDAMAEVLARMQMDEKSTKAADVAAATSPFGKSGAAPAFVFTSPAAEQRATRGARAAHDRGAPAFAFTSPAGAPPFPGRNDERPREEPRPATRAAPPPTPDVFTFTSPFQEKVAPRMKMPVDRPGFDQNGGASFLGRAEPPPPPVAFVMGAAVGGRKAKEKRRSGAARKLDFSTANEHSPPPPQPEPFEEAAFVPPPPEFQKHKAGFIPPPAEFVPPPPPDFPPDFAAASAAAAAAFSVGAQFAPAPKAPRKPRTSISKSYAARVAKPLFETSPQAATLPPKAALHDLDDEMRDASPVPKAWAFDAAAPAYREAPLEAGRADEAAPLFSLGKPVDAHARKPFKGAKKATEKKKMPTAASPAKTAFGDFGARATSATNAFPARADFVSGPEVGASVAYEAYEAGGAHYAKGDYEEAVRAYTSALIEALPGWPLAAKVLGNRAAALTMLARHRDALRDCDEATRLDTSLYKVYNRAARLRLSEGDSDGARASLDLARRAAVNEGDAAYVDDARTSLLATDALAADAERFSINLKLALEGVAAAAAAARAMHDAENTDTNANAGDDPPKAKPVPSSPRRRVRSAEAALRACRDAAAVAPRCRAVRAAQARALAHLDRWRDVEDVLVDSAHQCSSDDFSTDDAAVIARRLAEVFADDAALESAPELYVRCLRRSEAPDEVHESRSRADAALRAVSQSANAAAAVAERCAAELRRAARLRRAKARADDAQKHPRPPAHGRVSGLAWLLSALNDACLWTGVGRYTRGHYRAAVAMYKDALRLDALNECAALRATLHCNVAAAELVLERAHDAIDHCTQALRLRPQYGRARLRRARARARVGDADDALRDYDIYLRAARDAPGGDAQLLDSVKRERDKVAELRAAREKPAPKPRTTPPKQPAHNFFAHAQAQARGRHAHAHPAEARADDFVRPARPPPQPAARPPPPPQPEAERRPRERVNATLRVRANASHYVVLAVAQGARPIEVKRAYAKLALENHPDRNDSPGATAAMARINAAYEVLKDPQARAQYDLSLPVNATRFRR
ncbi:hypothetical protein M885DRAFT_485978 [Pelagophyceae sp. CCMP2097]|nr:hypothetical protein M885DRAFT_485978 [Pelagophyceae sp. CCMP2097]